MKHYQKKSGFTLIELLVVVLIIGILSAIALPQYQVAVDKARFSTIITNVRTLKNAAEVYYMANGDYPASLEDISDVLPGDYSHFSGGFAVGEKSEYYLSFQTRYVFGRPRNPTLGNNYAIWLDQSVWPGRIDCYAYNTSGERARRLCKSLGGTLAGAEEASCDGECTIYRLQ